MIFFLSAVESNKTTIAQRAEHFHHRGGTSENEIRIYA